MDTHRYRPDSKFLRTMRLLFTISQGFGFTLERSDLSQAFASLLNKARNHTLNETQIHI